MMRFFIAKIGKLCHNQNVLSGLIKETKGVFYGIEKD